MLYEKQFCLFAIFVQNEKTVKQISLVLPCYNPPENWVTNLCTIIPQIKAQLTALNFALTLVIVNDGSESPINDNIIAPLTQLVPEFKYISYTQNKGKGYALRQGVSATTTDWVLYTDIDLPYTLNSMLAVIKGLETADIIAGVRTLAYYQKTPLYRRLISRFFRFLLKILLNLAVTDTQCGLKAFNVKGKTIFLQTSINRFLFDLEFIYLAGKMKKIVVKPCVVELREGVEFSRMNLGILMGELKNFIRIIFHSFENKNN